MPSPVFVFSDVDLSQQPQESVVSIALKAQGAARVAFAIALLQDTTVVRQYVDEFDTAHIGQSFSMTKALLLRGHNVEVYGFASAGQKDVQQLHCEFFVNGQRIASSDKANLTFDDANAAAEFHINCLFK